MLMTVTNARSPATDLGFLLHKHPDRAQQFDLSFGTAQVFYPEASETRCTAALLVDVDPVGLVRGKPWSASGGLLDQYVNDRPYTASSFLSVAIGSVFSTALAVRCGARPELVDEALPLTARLPVTPARGAEGLVCALFEPLGYSVQMTRLPLDEQVPEWGESAYVSLTLSAQVRVKDLLSHLYVLLPVLDNAKHYWVGQDELEKLLRHGGDWLAAHPEKTRIAQRYLRHQRSLAREALARLVGLDVSVRALEIAARRLRLDRLPPRQRQRIELLHGGLTYRDARIEGFDAATLIEVIEHLDPDRLAALERVLFQHARPRLVIVTTPNVEYNVKYETLPTGKLRHPDHRFEWTRAEFQTWAVRVAADFGYEATFVPVGEVDPALGSPTQMAVLVRKAAAAQTTGDDA